MDFYLVRHGEARPEQEDPKRPLSAAGREEVEKVGRALAARGVEVAEILHSGKLRAKETAAILERFLSPAGGCREAPGISPGDDPMAAGDELAGAERPVMLVGHLPHLSRLASLLVKGDAEARLVDFPPAATVCLSRFRGKWEFRWALAPSGPYGGVDPGTAMV